MDSSNELNKSSKAGVDSAGISKLCVDINYFALKLKKSLDDVCDLVDDYSVYFNGDTSDDFTSKINNILVKQTMIKDNILSYVDDYNSVVSKFKTQELSITFNEIKIENGGNESGY